MDRTSSLRVAVALAASALALIAAPVTAIAQAPPGPVDASKLVPSLSPTFAPS
jgi:hypothetical protein